MRIRSSLFLFMLITFSYFQLMPNALAKPRITLTTHIESQTKTYRETFFILDEAFKRLGYRFSMVTLPGFRSLRQANEGIYDGEAHRFDDIAWRSNFSNLIIVPELLLTSSNAMYSLNIPNLEKPWQELAQYRVVVLRGSLWLTSMAKKHAKEVTALSSINQVTMFLEHGRADIALLPLEVGENMAPSSPISRTFSRISPPLKALNIYTFLHKKHKNLVIPLANALRQMKNDGSYNRLIIKAKK